MKQQEQIHFLRSITNGIRFHWAILPFPNFDNAMLCLLNCKVRTFFLYSRFHPQAILRIYICKLCCENMLFTTLFLTVLISQCRHRYQCQFCLWLVANLSLYVKALNFLESWRIIYAWWTMYDDPSTSLGCHHSSLDCAQ